MQDRPTTVELLQAVREFLAWDVVPTVADRGLRYQMAIALHALGIVEREVSDHEARLRAELDALHDLLGRPPAPPAADRAVQEARVVEANRELCERIRAGAADRGPWQARVLVHVQAVVEDKLRTSSPERLRTLLAGRAEAR